MYNKKKHHADRWKNRRRMAWMSLLGGLFFPLIILFVPDSDLTGIAAPFYTFIGAVVASYVGFSTWDDINLPDKANREDD